MRKYATIFSSKYNLLLLYEPLITTPIHPEPQVVVVSLEDFDLREDARCENECCTLLIAD